MSPRVRARILLVLALVVPTLYALLVAGTFLLGTRTTADLVSCPRSSRSVSGCLGEWTSDGAPDSGRVAGTSRGDRGQRVEVVLGPLGAYADRPDVLWIRVGVVLFVELVVVGSVLTTRRALGRGRAVGRSLAADPGAWKVVVLEAGRMSAGGAPYAAARPVGPDRTEVVDAAGRPMFLLDQRDSGAGEPSVAVVDPAGRLVGRIARCHPRGTLASYAFTDPAGGLLAMGHAAMTSIEVHLAAGPPVARLGVADGDRLVVRVERPLAPPGPLLLDAFLVDFLRLSSTRQVPSWNIVTGRGYS